MEISYSDFDIDTKIYGKNSICGLYDKDSKYIYKNFYDVKRINYKKIESVRKFLGLLNKHQIDIILEELEIDKNILKKKMETLSYGELIKILIIKLLINNSKIIFLENIDLYLNEKDLKSIIRLFKTHQKNHNIAIIFKSENIDNITTLCDKYIVIKDGQIIYSGKDLNKLPIKTKIMKLVDCANKKHAGLTYYKEPNDILKAIYRSVKK